MIFSEPSNPYRAGVADLFSQDFYRGVTRRLGKGGIFLQWLQGYEVDPAVVNLSDYETFFPERRPFFVEGANTFRFGREGTNNNWGFNWMDPMPFYSRRVGRSELQ